MIIFIFIVVGHSHTTPLLYIENIFVLGVTVLNILSIFKVHSHALTHTEQLTITNNQLNQ